MKKGLAFILALTMVLGSFGFAFAGSDSDGIDTISNISSENSIQVNYKSENSLAIEMSGADFVVIKQSSDFVLVWLADKIDNETDRQAFYSKLQAADPSLNVNYEDVIFTSNNQWTNTSASNVGAYYFVVPGSELIYDNGNTTLSSEYAVAGGGKVSHFLIGKFKTTPKYNIEYMINKNVVVSGGAFTEKTFDFDIKVTGLEGSAIKSSVYSKQITIAAGDYNGSAAFEMNGLKASDFPLRLEFKETSVSGDGWACDGSSYCVDVTLENGIVTYGNLIKIGDESFEPSVENEVTFTNYYNGKYQLSFPIEKDVQGDSGFPAEKFTFTATTTPGGAVVGASTMILTSDQASGNIDVELPAESKFPVTLAVQETKGDNPSWKYDGGCYLVTVGLVDGVPTITDIKSMPKDHSMTAVESNNVVDSIVFTNNYTAPLTFEIPFTKSIDGEKYGSETFHFAAQLILNDSEVAVISESESLSFSDGLATTDGAFKFELTSTQAAAWLPAQVKIVEEKGNTDGWDYDQNVLWAEVDKDGKIVQYTLNQTVTDSITFENKYKGAPIELLIPIKKIGNIEQGSFTSQTFNFDVSVQKGELWEALSGTSITLTYPNTMSGTATLKFTEDQLEEYIVNDGDTILLKIVEKSSGANYWTYDNTAYYVQITKNTDEWNWKLLSEAKEITFSNSYSYTSGSGTKDDSDKPTYEIEDNEIPITSDPGDIDMISIPQAEIPQTGGIGAAVFLALGGFTATLGTGLRKKEKR